MRKPRSAGSRLRKRDALWDLHPVCVLDTTRHGSIIYSPDWYSSTSAASVLRRSADWLRRSRSRACSSRRSSWRKYSRKMDSITPERDCFEPPRRSSAARTSDDSVIDVFAFILLKYYRNSARLCMRFLLPVPHNHVPSLDPVLPCATFKRLMPALIPLYLLRCSFRQTSSLRWGRIKPSRVAGRFPRRGHILETSCVAGNSFGRASQFVCSRANHIAFRRCR